MKPFIISCLFLVASFYCFAQSDCSIKKAYAYYNASMPGTQMVDENGNPITPKPNITRFIYVEYSGTKMPVIKAVLYNGEEISFSVTTIKEKIVWAGDKELNPDKRITAKKGNTLLKINLNMDGEKPIPETGCKSIVIKTKKKNGTCVFKLVKESEFLTLPRY